MLTELACSPGAELDSTFVMAVTTKLPNATVNNQKLMMVLFIESAAWVKAKLGLDEPAA